MAHEITKNSKTNQHEMAYVGDKPWHGLGQELPVNAPIETWLTAAGMDWEVKRSPLIYYASDDHLPNEVPGKVVLYRGHAHEAVDLGVVSAKYKVVQPREVLGFFKDLTAAHGYQLQTAGTLFGGKRFWALAKTGKWVEAARGDELRTYLLLSTSCDGSLATTARYTSVRVVCNNTLTLATHGKADVVVRHTSKFDADAVKGQLGLATELQRDFLTSVKALAATPLTAVQVETFLAELLVDTQTVFTKDPATSRQFTTIKGLYDGAGKGATLKGSKGTAWGLLNAVTEFVDHHARAKTTDARLASAWFGRGEQLKQTAFERLLTTDVK